MYTLCLPSCPAQLNNMKVWRAPHPPLRGTYWNCSRPMVHRGFLASYEASGLNLQASTPLPSARAHGGRPAPWNGLGVMGAC